MKPTSVSNAKMGMIRIRGTALKRLPRDVPGIERWIKAMGGRKASPADRAMLKKHGLLGMPTE